MIKIKSPDLSFIESVKGHIVALGTGARQALKPDRITIQYPRERRYLTDNFRGFILFDIESCISCFRCSFICPANAIQMKAQKNGRYYPCIDYAKCIFCHFCVDSCPVGALKQSKIQDVAFKDLEEKFIPTEELLELPEIYREDQYVVQYEVGEDLVLEKRKERVSFGVEVEPPFRVPLISTCLLPERCIACAICASTCPNEVISVEEVDGERILKMEKEKCTGCGLCVSQCPTKILGLIKKPLV
ncbi:MAG: 4Fe-4S binding protein [Methanosarcinales archaeon]